MSAARNAYIVCYDVSSQRRWRRLYKALRREGDHVQLSVFLVHWSPRERDRMESKLRSMLDEEEDRLMIVDLGPSDRSMPKRITMVGTPCEWTEDKAWVV